MPLVKGVARGSDVTGDPAPQRSTLDSSDAESRWTAARALAGHAEAVPGLAAALGRETVPRVREAIMTALMRIGDTPSVEAILPYLRSQDAGLRAAAIESLQALPEAIAPFMAALFSDRDSDVRLLATELARNMKASEATRLLCGLIDARTAPQCLRRSGGRADGSRDAGGHSHAGKMCGAICTNAVPAVRHLSGDRPHIGRGRLVEMAGPDDAESRSVHITPEEVQRFCEFLYRRTGMSFTEGKRYFIDRRLEDRVAATGSSTFQAYFSLLRADADHEIEHVINSFTVNETYFYREDHQLRCMTSSLLGAASLKPPGSTVRIWSIPCSTGEEPYSIALWLMENWPQVDNYNIEIVGSDIDTRALKAAAEGNYGDRALMRLSRDIITRYFTPIGNGNHQIDEGLRGSIEFTRANLIDAQDMARYRNFDLIFCRNVLIYFDDASRRQAAENLYDCLRPGGYICLGHSESMSRISPLFSVCRFPDAIVYQRPEADHG